MNPNNNLNTAAGLETALACIRKGWYVFPCRPRSKAPAIAGGALKASNDEAQVRGWWARMPDANPAIATGPSGLCVLDCDHGLRDAEGFRAWMAAAKLPGTYAVRTGRRDDFGVQLYYAGAGVKSIGWAEGGLEGDIRCSTGYVMAAGSVHPSGNVYEVLADAPVAPKPAYVTSLRSVSRTGATGNVNAPVTDDGSPITSHRNVTMISLLGRKRAEGADDDALRVYALEVNDCRMNPPLGEDEFERILGNACKFPVPEPEVAVFLRGAVPVEPAEPVDWRTRYHTLDEIEGAPPATFMVEGILHRDSTWAWPDMPATASPSSR